MGLLYRHFRASGEQSDRQVNPAVRAFAERPDESGKAAYQRRERDQESGIEDEH